MDNIKFFNALSSKGRNEFFKAFNDASNETRIALSDHDTQWLLQDEVGNCALLALLTPKDIGINAAKIPDCLKGIDIRMGVAIVSSSTTSTWLVLSKSIPSNGH